MKQEIAYMYGVTLGDGFFGYITHYDYYKGKRYPGKRQLRFTLTSIDLDFVELMQKNLSKVLGKEFKILKKKPSGYGINPTYSVGAGGPQLEKIYSLFKTYTPISKKEKIEVLRGLFDSEGCILVTLQKYGINKGKDYLIIHSYFDNTNIKIINLFSNTLTFFEIKHIIEKREYSPTKILYRIHIKKKALKKFYELLGNKLTIKRKDEKMKYLNGVWKNGNKSDVINRN